MSFNDFLVNAKVSIYAGMAFLIAGIFFYLTNAEGTMAGKVGVILFTCGAMFVGIAYACMIAWKQQQMR
ncbi:MAG: hypothetical protein KGH85_07795 [Thaumarchaeota archaeon]|nr:hypothetical protein [Nitrososphaerota archaeon]